MIKNIIFVKQTITKSKIYDYNQKIKQVNRTL